MPTPSKDKSFRTVQGAATPTKRGAEYQVQRYPVPPMKETGAAPKDGQARSPAPKHLGATRGVAAGGRKVPEAINRSAHSRVWGLESS